MALRKLISIQMRKCLHSQHTQNMAYATSNYADWEPYMNRKVQVQEDDTCTNHAILELVQGLHKLQMGQAINLSVEHFLRSAVFQNIEAALKFVQKKGLLQQKDFPHNTKKGDRIRILSFHRVHGRKHILRATSQGPILGALKAHDALVHYKGGILSLNAIRNENNLNQGTQERCRNEGCKHYLKTAPSWCRRCGFKGKEGHAVVITGYDTRDKKQSFLRIKNSWSNVWGEKGYARIHLPPPITKVREVEGYFDVKKQVWVFDEEEDEEEDKPEGVLDIEREAWVVKLK